MLLGHAALSPAGDSSVTKTIESQLRAQCELTMEERNWAGTGPLKAGEHLQANSSTDQNK